MASVYKIVTEKIMTALESGEIPWHKPWCSVNAGAFNRFSGRHYSLLNQMLLSKSGEYGTLNQWAKIGGSVIDGEFPELVVFWKWPESPDITSNNSEEDEVRNAVKKYPVLRYYRVYHVSQIKGVTPLEHGFRPFNTSPLERAEALLHGYVEREKIHLEQELSNEAYYSPVTDTIHVPALEQFKYAEEFYSAALHEAVHSTGSKKRLNRKGLQNIRYGSEQYSQEELIAEIGRACLISFLNIETDRSIMNSAGYIQGWLHALQDDERFFVYAASQAEKAVKFILFN